MRAAALGLAGLLAAAGTQAAPYTLDPTHTFVVFEVAHDGLSTTRGRFDRKSGSVDFDRAGRRGRVEIRIDTASVDTGVPALDRALQAPGLLASAQYPAATFASERFLFDGDALTAVDGTLTIAGRSRPLTLKARAFNCYPNPLFRREACGGDFEATLRRSDWGFAEGLPPGVADEVRLLVTVEAIRQ